jgi:hypothetical protein
VKSETHDEFPMSDDGDTIEIEIDTKVSRYIYIHNLEVQSVHYAFGLTRIQSASDYKSVTRGQALA